MFLGFMLGLCAGAILVAIVEMIIAWWMLVGASKDGEDPKIDDTFPKIGGTLDE